MASAVLRASSTVWAAESVLAGPGWSAERVRQETCSVQREVLLQNLRRYERPGDLDPAVLEPVESLGEGDRHVH